MGPAPPPQKSGMPGWLIGILVALALVVVLCGIMGILAVYGVHKYLAAAKTAEALSSVMSMANEGDSAYGRNGALCKSASSPVPASMSAVAGHKYMSNPAEWTSDPADTGFPCLGFEMMSPQYYQYDYKQTSPDSFIAVAHGDLDGDGVTSEFSITGTVVSGSVELGTVTQKNPEE
ncbi:MAG TPA: hypothetical protein VGH28_01815 [Polyangiaceae bacterium]|jgi:hypothetical protein